MGESSRWATDALAIGDGWSGWQRCCPQRLSYGPRRFGQGEVAKNKGAEKVSHRVLWGSPAAELIDLAQRSPGSLTVMSTHGRSGISRWVLGSVTDRVVRHTHQPVLVVRARSAESPKQENIGAERHP